MLYFMNYISKTGSKQKTAYKVNFWHLSTMLIIVIGCFLCKLCVARLETQFDSEIINLLTIFTSRLLVVVNITESIKNMFYLQNTSWLCMKKPPLNSIF